MSSLAFWSMIAILIQTIVCLILTWPTLVCTYSPNIEDLSEATLIKVLYLYDPVACNRVYFYNYTVFFNGTSYKTIFWISENKIAADFRSKTKAWITLHIFWFILSILNLIESTRSRLSHFSLLPFTVVGTAVIAVDVIYAILFLVDVGYTGNQASILEYIDGQEKHVHSFNKDNISTKYDRSDTSWIALLMAYVSIRGVVVEVFNFWIVKDNYFAAVAQRRKPQRRKNSNFSKASYYSYIYA
ncbi:uncharacterized protein LOC101739818 isoform X3 [Bombyx mori]|uniref:Uncharacterized protein n=1 Tax=Bombyx mori TaxID=7091 RepID=A0A8R2DK40_BOMMO|nr:uncharacterized protein LOC101739818 [Bombyx mori]